MPKTPRSSEKMDAIDTSFNDDQLNGMQEMYGSPRNISARPNTPISAGQAAMDESIAIVGDIVGPSFIRGQSSMNGWPTSTENASLLTIKSSPDLNNGMESVYGSPINSQKVSPLPTKTINSPVTIATPHQDTPRSISPPFYGNFRKLSTFFQNPLESMFGSPAPSTKIQPKNKIIPIQNDITNLSFAPDNIDEDVSEYPIISRPTSRKNNSFAYLSELFKTATNQPNKPVNAEASNTNSYKYRSHTS